MRAALLQVTSGDDPQANLAMLAAAIEDAASAGAGFVLTPEVVNCVSLSRRHQSAVLTSEAADPVLAGLREIAARRGVWLLAGSLALLGGEADGRFANRSLLIDPTGAIAARYDKIHMFDVSIGEGESYRESDGFRPGENAVLARTPFAAIGLSICYDLRFPALYRALAQAGAEVLCVPSAFSTATGAEHWRPLLQARAIENGAWVLAPAQTGRHPASSGRQRRTWGHSLAVDPWGRVVAAAGEAPQTLIVDLDLEAVAAARRKLPSLTHDRDFTSPEAGHSRRTDATA